MQLSDLLHSRVRDADGTDLGKVADVLLVQDGPYVEGFGHALRVEGLVVGRAGLGVRLGYHRKPVEGPWMLRTMFSALERRARYVAWRDVSSWGDGELTTSQRGADLGPPPG
jgi:hypothetical protein